MLKGKLLIKSLIVYSYMSRYENSQNPFKIRREAISLFFKNACYYISEDYADDIQKKAAEIMKTGIKAKDAIHIACAIFGKADFFLSTDIRLLKYNTQEVILMNPITFVTEREEFL